MQKHIFGTNRMAIVEVWFYVNTVGCASTSTLRITTTGIVQLSLKIVNLTIFIEQCSIA